MANNNTFPSAGGPGKEIGVPGLFQFSGIIRQDFLRELQGKEAYKRYLEMKSNSPVIGALLLAIEQSIRGIEWTFTSTLGDKDPRLELLQESWDGMTTGINDHIVECLSFLPFGYSLFEIVYKKTGANRWLWKKFAPRGQGTVFRWLFDDVDGDLLGFVQQAPPKYEMTPIPIQRLLLYRAHIELGNPEGRSILRTAWIPYYYCKHVSQVEAIGIERDLAGMPLVILPPDASTSDNENDTATDTGKANALVRRVRNDDQAGVVLPFGWDFKLLSTGGSRQFDTNAVISRYESRMLMSALAQFLMLGQAGSRGGSRAQSGEEMDFFTMSVNAVADIISDTHTKFAIPRLMGLNGYPTEGLKMEHSVAGDIDIAKLADFLQKTTGLITWTPADEVWLRSIGKLPMRTEEEIQAEQENRANNELAQAKAQLQIKQEVMQTVDSPSSEVPAPGDTTNMASEPFLAGTLYPRNMIYPNSKMRNKFWDALDRFDKAMRSQPPSGGATQ